MQAHRLQQTEGDPRRHHRGATGGDKGQRDSRDGHDPQGHADVLEHLERQPRGHARGYEPVHYVQRIRNYRDVIRSAFE